MAKEREELPFKALKRTGVLWGALALGYASRRYKDAPTAIAKSLGDRLGEVLPADEYTVNVDGPGLYVERVRGGSSAGMPGVFLLERGSPEEKLTRVYMEAAESLRGMLAGVEWETPTASGMSRARFPAAFFDPHVVVTDATIEVWWGGKDPGKALVKLRPIPRSEVGL